MAANVRLRAPIGKQLIDEPLLDPGIGVDTAIAQERPMRPRYIDTIPVDFGHHDLFAIGAPFRDDLAARRDDEALAPELDAVAAGRRFMTDAIDRRDVTAVRDRVAALHGFPGGILGRAVLFFLAWMPTDRCRIKKNLRAAKGGEPRRFRIPLVPTNADADFSVRGRPCLESEIARREIKLFVVRRIVRDMHLAILAEITPVRIDDRGGVVINAGRAFLKKRGDDDRASFARDFLQLRRRRSRNFLGEREVRVIFALAEILGAE